MRVDENQDQDQELSSIASLETISSQQAASLYEQFIRPLSDKLAKSSGWQIPLATLSNYLFSAELSNGLGNDNGNDLKAAVQNALPLVLEFYRIPENKALIDHLLSADGLDAGIQALIVTPGLSKDTQTSVGADDTFPAIIAFITALDETSKKTISTLFCLLPILIACCFDEHGIHAYNATNLIAAYTYSITNENEASIQTLISRQMDCYAVIKTVIKESTKAAKDKSSFWQQCLQGEAQSLSDLISLSKNTNLEQRYLLDTLKHWDIFQLYRLHDFDTNTIPFDDQDKQTIKEAWNSKPLILQWIVTIYFSLYRFFACKSKSYQHNDKNNDMDLLAACSTYCPII